MCRLLILLVLLAPSGVMAAYLDPVVETVQTLPNGLSQVHVRFNGDAGEPPVQMSYLVRPGSNLRAAREWAKDVVDELDSARTAAAIPGLQPGQTIQRVARVNPVKAAKQAWREKFDLYLRIKDSGVAAIAGYITTLKADIEATYQTGFLDE